MTRQAKKFRSEAEEAAYWLEHPGELEAAVTDEPAFSVAEVFPNLAPSTERVNIRMPASLLVRIKQTAARRDVPYQTLIKAVLFDTFFPRQAIGSKSRRGRASHNKPSRAAPGAPAHTAKDLHVVPHARGWAVIGAGNKRATSIHRTQDEAARAARETARQRGSKVVIHNRQGRVRDQTSYGTEPRS